MANVKVVWKEGIYFEGIADKHVVHMDGRPEAGGQDLGVSPMQLLLIALGGCTGMDVISILKKMRQNVTHFEMELSGSRAPEHPKRYTQIEIVYRLRGRQLDRAMVEKAVNLSEERYCSVGATIKQTAPIITRIEIEEEEIPQP